MAVASHNFATSQRQQKVSAEKQEQKNHPEDKLNVFFSRWHTRKNSFAVGFILKQTPYC